MKDKGEKKNINEVILVTVISTVILVIALGIAFVSISNKEDYMMHYSDSSNLDYNVYLRENDFYATPYLPKDRAYISTLINYIDASFNYNFEVVEDINLGYTYRITAKVIVDENSGKGIFDEEEVLLDKTQIQNVKDNKFSISEKVNIDYNKYNRLASAFIDEYGITAKATLIVSMYVDVVGTHEQFEKQLNDSAVVSFEIPLTTKTTEIKMNYDLKNNANETFEYGKTFIEHPILLTISIVVALIDIVCMLYEIISYNLNKDGKVKYKAKLKKIFRDYGSYISKKAIFDNMREIMYTISLRIEMVDTFDDLINVRDSIEKPILFYESIPGEQAVFYIIDTKVSYVYMMDAREFSKGKKDYSSLNYFKNESNMLEGGKKHSSKTLESSNQEVTIEPVNSKPIDKKVADTKEELKEKTKLKLEKKDSSEKSKTTTRSKINRKKTEN